MTASGNITKWQWRAGVALRALITLVFLFSAGMKLAHASAIVTELTRAGLPESAILPIGLLELTCLALYWTPRTSILGTFLLTGYLGGAIVTHIIARQSFLAPLVVGIWMFAGAWLRDAELRRLVPFRATGTGTAADDPAWRARPALGLLASQKEGAGR